MAENKEQAAKLEKLPDGAKKCDARGTYKFFHTKDEEIFFSMKLKEISFEFSHVKLINIVS